MEMVLSSKADNSDIKYLAGVVPQDWMEGDEGKASRKLRRYRELRVDLSALTIFQNDQEQKLLLKDGSQSKYNQKQAQKADKDINFGVQYSSMMG
jgi:hypothetical protein